MKFAILFPFHNEEATLPGVCERLCALRNRYGWKNCVLIGIDDGSTDASHDIVVGHSILALYSGTNGWNSRNGVGAALITGVREALELGCDFVVNWSSKGKFNEEDLSFAIDTMLVPSLDIKYMRGMRLKQHKGIPVKRQIALFVCTKVFNLVTGLDSTDPINGVRLYRIGELEWFTDERYFPFLETIKRYEYEFFIEFFYMKKFPDQYREFFIRVNYTHLPPKKYTHVRPFIDYFPVLWFLVKIRLLMLFFPAFRIFSKELKKS